MNTPKRRIEIISYNLLLTPFPEVVSDIFILLAGGSHGCQNANSKTLVMAVSDTDSQSQVGVSVVTRHNLNN